MIGLKLFGEMEIRGEAGSIDLAGSKLSALLAVLVVAGGKPVARDSLAEMLWGSHFEEQARQSLRQALTRLRKLLGGDVLVPDDRFVRLRTEMVASDHASFMKLAPSTDAMALREAADLARGEFMAGLALREPGFSDWLAAERRRIEGMLQDVQRRLAHVELEQGDAKGALSRAEAVLARDALDEEAHRLRVLALAALGRKPEALKAHQAFAEQLRAELGTVTSAETEQLVTQLKAPAPAAEPAGAARPSLLVLPFATPGSEAGQDYFAEGMVDELITALSRLRWLAVLSRSSTFSERARGLEARAAGEVFGVRYVLEGSIRRAGQALRITGQLIETATGATLWAERFDGSIDELFDLQDRVAARALGALQPRLERAEIDRSQRKPTGSLDAYDHYLRGLAEVHRWTREANAAALRHFYKAIALDGNFAAAYGMAARCYSQRLSSGWMEDHAKERAEAERLAGRAVSFGYDDPIALSSAGIALAFVAGHVGEGGALIERALQLNPGLAAAWLYLGWVRAWNGEADAAIAATERAIELSPHDPSIASMRRAIAFAHFIAGRYAEALSCAEAVATAAQNAGIASATLAASHEMLGHANVAKAEVARLLGAEPQLCLANLRLRFPIVKDEDYRRFSGALERAGLPPGEAASRPR